MLSIVQPGWLLLFLCSILLILVGCTVIPKRAPTIASTANPSETWTLVPFFTETPLVSDIRPSVSMSITTVSEYIPYHYSSTAPPTMDAYAEAATCFGRANGGYSCLGKVWNRGKRAMGGILLRVQLLDSHNQVLAEQEISLEQAIIPNDTFAPYRVLFEPLDAEKTHIRSTIIEQFPTLPTLTTLKIANEDGQVTDSGRYHLTATIENDLSQAVNQIRLFATLMNPQHEVVGYRIYEVDGTLQPAEQRAVDFEVIPQVIPYNDAIEHILHAEGRIGD
jgi:hypothetical protein